MDDEDDKPRIVLDLDQTLISGEAIEEYNFKKYKEKAKLFDFDDMDGYYIIFQRPGLQEFLDFLFKYFKVSVWTAATKDYALFIIDKIILADKPGRELDWVFFSYHCDISDRIKKNSKDLKMLWEVYGIPGYNENNTVILDDYEEVHESQPGNCIIAEPFFFENKGSEKDDFLYRLKPILKRMIKNIDTGDTQPAMYVNKKLGNGGGAHPMEYVNKEESNEVNESKIDEGKVKEIKYEEKLEEPKIENKSDKKKSKKHS